MKAPALAAWSLNRAHWTDGYSNWNSRGGSQQKLAPLAFALGSSGPPSDRVEKGTVPHADEAPAWNDLLSRFEMKRINHEQTYSKDGACTNWAESYFSRLRRGEMGHHHRASGPYLLRFAQEAAWREDNRRVSNGDQVQRVITLALGRKPSVDFIGCWQRHK